RLWQGRHCWSSATPHITSVRSRPSRRPSFPNTPHPPKPMLRSLTSAISGLQNFQERMDVIGNNIANVNTTAFKSARVDFADSFSQTLRNSSAGTENSSGTTAMQIGSGVSTAAIRNLYTQGAITGTNVPTDLAIAG